ncbi:MAG: hypothetical protein ACE5J7_00710 [Candidatus Aenigmatarchaeota archaeon]
MTTLKELGVIADFPKDMEGHMKARQADILILLSDGETKAYYRVSGPDRYYDIAMKKTFPDEDHRPNPLGPTYRQALETCKEIGTEITEEEFKRTPKIPGPSSFSEGKKYYEFRVAPQEEPS